MSLRVRGIYSLPNGRELIVLGSHRNGRATYRLGGWQQFELTEYEVDENGRLTYHGKLTAWDVANLKDTGLTALAYSHPLDRRLRESESVSP